MRLIQERTNIYLVTNKHTYKLYNQNEKSFSRQYFMLWLAGRKSNGEKAKTISLHSSWPNEVNKFNGYIFRNSGDRDLIIIRKKSYIDFKRK